MHKKIPANQSIPHYVITSAQWNSITKIDKILLRLDDQNGNKINIVVDTNGIVNKCGPLIEAAKKEEEMPDLATEFTATCQSNFYWSAYVPGVSENGYVVKWCLLDSKEMARQGAEYGWNCECKAFKFRKAGFCKHVDRVEHLRCRWNAQLDPGLKSENDTCPRCGSSVIHIEVAV